MSRIIEFNPNMINALFIIVNKPISYSVNGTNIFKTIFFFILALPLFTYSQQKKHIDPDREQDKIYGFFEQYTPWKTTKDSSAVYAFSFKVTVRKDVHGVAKVTSLIASDNIAYQIYSNYKFLKTINYSVFMGNRRSADIILPLVIEVISSRGDGITKTDFLKSTKSLLHLRSTGWGAIVNYIFTPPYLIRINKQVID